MGTEWIYGFKYKPQRNTIKCKLDIKSLSARMISDYASFIRNVRRMAKPKGIGTYDAYHMYLVDY